MIRVLIPVVLVLGFGSQSYSQDLRQIKSIQQSCTSQTANYVGTDTTFGGDDIFYCVTSSGVIYRSVEGGVFAGEIGKIGVQIRKKEVSLCGVYPGRPNTYCDTSSITQYNVEDGYKLMKYECRGYHSCNGPVSSSEFAISLD